MVSACMKISKYIRGIPKSDFLLQSMTQSAVIMQLQIIGEMAKKLDGKTKKEIEAPWSMIVGLRNIISHDYFMLNLETIWDIASVNVPALEKELHLYLKTQGTEYLPPFDDTTPLMG